LSIEQIENWLNIIPEFFNVKEKNTFLALSSHEFYFALNINKNDDKPLLLIRDEFEWITISIVYDDPKQLKDLKNFITMKNNPSLKDLLSILNSLDPNYKTKLVKRTEKNGDCKYIEIRSYITNRIDGYLINRLIIETEGTRQEIFKKKTDNFEKPVFILTQLSIPKSQEKFNDALKQSQTLYLFLSNLRGQVAFAVPKRDKTQEMQSSYNALVKMLNEAQKRNLISPQNRRELEKQWRTNSEMKQEIVTRLEAILKN